MNFALEKTDAKIFEALCNNLQHDVLILIKKYLIGLFLGNTRIAFYDRVFFPCGFYCLCKSSTQIRSYITANG